MTPHIVPLWMGAGRSFFPAVRNEGRAALQRGIAYCPQTRVALLPCDKKAAEEMSSAVGRLESCSGGARVLIRNLAIGSYEISGFIVVSLQGLLPDSTVLT